MSEVLRRPVESAHPSADHPPAGAEHRLALPRRDPLRLRPAGYAQPFRLRLRLRRRVPGREQPDGAVPRNYGIGVGKVAEWLGERTGRWWRWPTKRSARRWSCCGARRRSTPGTYVFSTDASAMPSCAARWSATSVGTSAGASRNTPRYWAVVSWARSRAGCGLVASGRSGPGPRRPGRRTAPTPHGTAPRRTPQPANPSETRPAPRTFRQSVINTTAEGSASTEPRVKALSGPRGGSPPPSCRGEPRPVVRWPCRSGPPHPSRAGGHGPCHGAHLVFPEGAETGTQPPGVGVRRPRGGLACQNERGPPGVGGGDGMRAVDTAEAVTTAIPCVQCRSSHRNRNGQAAIILGRAPREECERGTAGVNPACRYLVSLM